MKFFLKNSRGEWYVLIQFALIFLTLFGPRAFFWNFSFSLHVALILAGLGAFFFFTSLFSLKKNLTPLPYPRKDSSLTQKGPYHYIRHPMYFSVILFALAWAIFLQNGATLFYAFLISSFLDIKARREELWLSEKFPEYSSYRAHTKRLIPFIY